MSFEVILQQAKEGNTQAILEIVEMYKPLIIRNAIVEGFFDEDLYQELIRVLLYCIRNFNILE